MIRVGRHIGLRIGRALTAVVNAIIEFLNYSDGTTYITKGIKDGKFAVWYTNTGTVIKDSDYNPPEEESTTAAPTTTAYSDLFSGAVKWYNDNIDGWGSFVTSGLNITSGVATADSASEAFVADSEDEIFLTPITAPYTLTITVSGLVVNSGQAPYIHIFNSEDSSIIDSFQLGNGATEIEFSENYESVGIMLNNLTELEELFASNFSANISISGSA